MENDRLKFYADTPRGDTNKLFTFNVQNYEHAIDLASLFVQDKEFTIRAAWYENPNGISLRFDKMVDLFQHKNSIIEQKDKQNLEQEYRENQKRKMYYKL